MPKMRPVGAFNGFHGSIHVIRSRPAVHVDIDEARRNVALFQFNERSGPGERRLSLDGCDPAIANQEMRIR